METLLLWPAAHEQAPKNLTDFQIGEIVSVKTRTPWPIAIRRE